MTYYPDLGAIDYFPVKQGDVLRAVGWLSHEFEFPTGKVPPQFLSRLCELLQDPWQPMLFRGFHTCELCQFQNDKNFEGTAVGTNNLFVPFNGLIYVAPELIVHYINAHHYLPPAVFLDAVMQCPNMRSMEYKKKLLKNGGRGLTEL